jgi:hypothetical protein
MNTGKKGRISRLVYNREQMSARNHLYLLATSDNADTMPDTRKSQGRQQANKSCF